MVDDALKTDRLHLINVTGGRGVLEEMTEYLSSDTSAPVRVCIPTMGAPNWGELTGQVSDASGLLLWRLRVEVEYPLAAARSEGTIAEVWTRVCGRGVVSALV